LNETDLFRVGYGVGAISNTSSRCGYVTAPVSRLQLSRQTEDALAFGPTAKRFSRVLGMFSSLEVKVLRPT